MRSASSILHAAMLSCCVAISISEATPLPVPQLVISDGHDGRVMSAAYSPNGSLFLSGGEDGTVRLWDANSGKEVRQIKGHTSSVAAVAFSPDGRTIVSGSADKTVRLWDPTNGKELRRLVGHTDTVRSVAFSPDGYSVLSGSYDKTLRLWRVADGKLLRKMNGHVDQVGSVAFSPNGRKILSSGDDRTMRLWSALTGKQLRRFDGHFGSVVSIAFSPDGRSLLSGSEDMTVRLWDEETGRELSRMTGHANSIFTVTFSSDGRTLLSGGADQTLRTWDASNGRQLSVIDGHLGSVWSAAFSPDGLSILSGDDKTLRLWDAISGKELLRMRGHASPVLSAAFSHNGLSVVSGGSDNALHLWDVPSGKELRRFNGHTGWVWSTAFSLDGSKLLSGSADATMRLWDVSNGQSIRTFDGHVGDIKTVAFGPQEGMVVSGGRDETVRVWDAVTGKELRLIDGNRGPVTSIALGPDGRTLLSGTGDSSLCLWDTSTGKVARCMKGHVGAVLSVAFSANGLNLLSGGVDQTMRLWDARSGRELRRFDLGGGWVFAVAISPDGHRLLAGSNDKTLRTWDAAHGKMLRRYVGNGSSVLTVGFNSDGSRLFSGGDDKSLRLWDSASGNELASLISFTDGTWIVTDAEGRFDTSDLESMPHLHWVMPDDPFTPVPLEVFMKDYYTPRLLGRIMAGEKFPPVRPLMTLNRTQPEVKISGVVPDANDPSLVSVTVTASGATKNYLQGDDSAGGKETARATAAHDLRLFRDGQVVGYADGKLAEFKGAPFAKTFTVRLPQAKAGQDVVFSAYAFNDDRVKSETVRTTFKAPPLQQASPSKGTAYVITIGVNQHENRAWNLSFAANDARAVSARVAGDLRKSGRYAEVVPVTLAADGPTPGNRQASKAAIRTVFARLSGAASGELPEVLRGVAGAEALRRVTPDDTLIIAFSGHGFTDEQGMFYLMPQDTGAGQGKTVTPLLRSRSISSDELSLWLRDVDAGDMTMIVDACQSAASIASEGFKPGPMGSRGLGQLSFDKGMRILSASQSDQYALEDGKLQHGLLTFSLINDGLDAFNADHEPKDKTIYLDEWLKYGVKRVPTLWEEVKTGKINVVNRSADRGGPVVLNATGGQAAAPAITRQQAQTPALFDFAKNRKAFTLVTDPSLKAEGLSKQQ